MECSVCNQEIKGRFCYSCGQLISNKKVSILGFIRDFFANIFSLESPLLKIAKSLLLQPAFVINNYIAGNKGYFFSPSKLLFYALLIIGIFLTVFPEPKRIFALNFNVDGISPQMLFILFMVPILSFFSYVTYFRLKRGFVEHLVSISYLLSLWTILLAIVEAFFRVTNWLTVEIELTILFLLLFLIFYSNAVVFSKKKSIPIYFLNSILSIAVTIALFYSLLYIMKLFMPNLVHI
jgi:hypothetical protein